MDKDKTLAIDFDGVIHSFENGWLDGNIYGEPVEDSIKYLTLLRKKGYKLIVFTTREDLNAVSEWMTQKGVPFDEVTNKKPMALAYIDDRGIRFTNWRDINNYF